MTSYNLEATSIFPLSKNKPQQIIVLCHGYGGDGKDISTLAIGWQRFLPNAIFLCPNAPEICSISPQGFQWFDLSSDKEEIILEKSLIAEEKLNIFLDEALDNFQLIPANLGLVGFSQGSMVALDWGLRSVKAPMGFVLLSSSILSLPRWKERMKNKFIPVIYLLTFFFALPFLIILIGR